MTVDETVENFTRIHFISLEKLLNDFLIKDISLDASSTQNVKLIRCFVCTKYFLYFPLFLQKSRTLFPPPDVAQPIDGLSDLSLSPNSGGR